jgi:hypothetical protein
MNGSNGFADLSFDSTFNFYRSVDSSYASGWEFLGGTTCAAVLILPLALCEKAFMLHASV